MLKFWKQLLCQAKIDINSMHLPRKHSRPNQLKVSNQKLSCGKFQTLTNNEMTPTI